MAQTRSSGRQVPPRRAAPVRLQTVDEAGSAMLEAPSQTSRRGAARPGSSAPQAHRHDEYVVPLVHVHLPGPVVTAGFFAALGAAVVAGMVDVPVAVLGALSVAIVRHRRS